MSLLINEILTQIGHQKNKNSNPKVKTPFFWS